MQKECFEEGDCAGNVLLFSRSLEAPVRAFFLLPLWEKVARSAG